MRRPSWVFLLVGAAVSAAALVTSAGAVRPRGATIVRVAGPITALSLNGDRVAYDVATHANKVLVRDLRTGATTKMSGRFTTDWTNCFEGDCDFQLAIAGSRVAWLFFGYGNIEADDYLLASSLSKPKEHHVATYKREADGCGASEGICPGTKLWGLVGAGDRILIGRWTTDDSGAVTDSGLYAVGSKRLKRLATATGTPVAADSQRVALRQRDGAIGIYSTTGTPLASVTLPAQAMEVALSGRKLVVLEPDAKIAVCDARTGALRKTFTLRWKYLGGAFAVHGNVAVYSRPGRLDRRHRESAIRAINLSSGKDRRVGRLRGDIDLAAIDSVGLVYASSIDYRNARLAFLPFKRVAAAVS